MSKSNELSYDELILQIREYERKQRFLEEKSSQLINKLKSTEEDQSKLEKSVEYVNKEIARKESKIEQLKKRNHESRLKNYQDIDLFELINEKQITLNFEIKKLRWENKLLREIFFFISETLNFDNKIFYELVEVTDDIQDKALKSFLEMVIQKIKDKEKSINYD
ncbi:hypothetical protein H312_01212 [Anncaliia algerae PRA339]|uniref:Uncharacterized protein n=1 Tax=Anncaliia algerae PRA339 TaxID=1288291 RepID=A0A059F214_9MICR|nr:hypothetical protein H312_01212 [Anncaliia algerae PRA339]